MLYRINSESITCGTRDVDDVKKRWKDIKLRVKKKEAARKQGQRKTGGGPPPNVQFKPWEMEVCWFIIHTCVISHFLLFDSKLISFYLYHILLVKFAYNVYIDIMEKIKSIRRY